uniref:LicD/FKTN/FKRP nucleotidyltransferase domain-containing protein n=1 Tax=viral metagenome TaxID=1070528 RepID=A0A6C0E5G4_9ZZZZ
MKYDANSSTHRNVVLDAITRGKKFEKQVYPSFVNFIEFIQKQNGKYVLSSGTLLGCIRNNKRILWDDDFDIFMFEKHMTIFNSQSDFSFTCDKDIRYKISYGNYNYIITKPPYDFYQVWCVDIINNKILNKTMDIFCEMYYQNCRIPWYTHISMEMFNGRLYNIPLNYDDELKACYGNNYMNEYVCCNHEIASVYYDQNKEKYLIMTKDEYNSFC